MEERDEFREKLILTEYEFYRREYYAVHSPTLLGGALAINVALGVYLYERRDLLTALIGNEQEESDVFIIVIQAYVGFLLVAFFYGIKSVLTNRRAIEMFTVEQEYDKQIERLRRLEDVHQQTITDKEIRSAARDQVFDHLENRTKNLRAYNMRRRGRHKSANNYLQLSIILGGVLLIVVLLPRHPDGELKTIEEIFEGDAMGDGLDIEQPDNQ